MWLGMHPEILFAQIVVSARKPAEAVCILECVSFQSTNRTQSVTSSPPKPQNAQSASQRGSCCSVPRRGHDTPFNLKSNELEVLVYYSINMGASAIRNKCEHIYTCTLACASWFEELLCAYLGCPSAICGHKNRPTKVLTQTNLFAVQNFSHIQFGWLLLRTNPVEMDATIILTSKSIHK